jgi:ABC-type nitrate/sulfonate/bicarbonate transport system substrate-binding protein
VGAASAAIPEVISLRIGGVPEHFNLPWRKLLAGGGLGSIDIDAHWEDYPSGTGAMVSALDDEALDVAVLLTEGAVAGASRSSKFRIVSLYTSSPLIWGVHVPADSGLVAVRDLEHARYAISRRGSGSHLMAYAYAQSQGWQTQELVFEVVGGLDGAIEAFRAGRADVFLWEKFMTKPLVDAGRFRRVDELVAPWPAFVVCASLKALRDKRDAIARVLEEVFPAAAAVRADPATPNELAERYGLDPADAVQWLAVTEWAATPGIDPTLVYSVADALAALDLLGPAPRDGFVARIVL